MRHGGALLFVSIAACAFALALGVAAAPFVGAAGIVALFTARSVVCVRTIGVTVRRFVASNWQVFVIAYQAKFDAAAIQIDAADLYSYPGTNLVAYAGALTAQFLACFIKAEIVAAEFGDMHQTFDIECIERDKDAKGRGGGDGAGVFLAQMVAHELALEPGFHIAAGFVSAALVSAAMQASGFPGLYGGRGGFAAWLLLWLHYARCQAFGHLGFRFARCWQVGQFVACALQFSLDDAVHQQVWVAANRAGEVGVSLKCQTKVAAIFWRVEGLHHGAQQHGVNLLRVWPVLGGVGNVLEVFGAGVVANRDTNAKSLEIVAQDLLLFHRRLVVHAVQAQLPALLGEVSSADVGSQHGLFNQLVGFIARARNDFFNAATVVRNDLSLYGFKVHRAACLARLQQGLVGAVQVQQVVDPVLALGGFRSACVGQNGGHFGIGEARMAVHDSRVELVGVNFASGRDQHVADHAQTIDIRIQRAQAIAELFRQHGDDAARKVHAGCSVIGINIDVAAIGHIVADVGNGHQQAPTFAAADLGGLAINSIVKVACVFAVNSDQSDVRQINAALVVGRAYRFWQSLGLGQAAERELMRHAIFAHCNFDFHTGVINFTENFDDASNGLTKQRRRFSQFHHHDLARLSGSCGVGWNQYILAVAFVFRCHYPDTTFLQEAANQRLG